MTNEQELTDVWTAAMGEIGPAVPPTRRGWLDGTQPIAFSNDVIVVSAPHPMARDWLDQEIGHELRRAVTVAAGRPVNLVVTHAPDSIPTSPAPEPVHTAPTSTMPPEPAVTRVVEEPRAYAPHAPVAFEERRNGEMPGGLHAPGRPAGPVVALPPPRPPREDVERPMNLNPKYLFENFVVGSSNRLARAAAFAVAEAPANSYNPLFIYGKSGLGKTHLLHAVGHYVRTLYPRMRVCYLTTEQFTNEFINAIQTGQTAAFQKRYRQVDVLLIDDIQFLERAERTQEEFFHTFNHLHGAEKQIVISSDRPPNKIARLEDRLRSRFAWGLLTDVQPPELETRIAIISRKAEQEQLGISRDVLEFIATKVQSNIRELEGALIRVTAYASLHHTKVDLAVAATVLKDVLPSDIERRISCSLIMEEVASYFELSVADLQSRSRSKHLVTARHIAMYLVREMTDLSLPKIGEEFGKRDHTTVINAKDKIANQMKAQQQTYDQVTELTNQIKSLVRA